MKFTEKIEIEITYIYKIEIEIEIIFFRFPIPGCYPSKANKYTVVSYTFNSNLFLKYLNISLHTACSLKKQISASLDCMST